MAALTVVVTFYSRGGSTESLAHAAAVGAVQARALIRLRRVADADEAAVLERLADCRDALRRMHKEYVAPRDADVAAADVLVFASPADVTPAAPEWAPFVAMLERMQAEGKLGGKVAAVIPTGLSSSAFDALVRRLGFETVTDEGEDTAAMTEVDRAVALGRRAATAAERRRLGRAGSST
jgi:flavodoxin